MRTALNVLAILAAQIGCVSMAWVLSVIHTQSVRRFCTESGDWTTCVNPGLLPEYMDAAFITAFFAFFLVILSATIARSRKLFAAGLSFLVWGGVVTLVFNTIIGLFWAQYAVVGLGGGLGVLCSYLLWRHGDAW
jgi:hypothetical protein